MNISSKWDLRYSDIGYIYPGSLPKRFTGLVFVANFAVFWLSVYFLLWLID